MIAPLSFILSKVFIEAQCLTYIYGIDCIAYCVEKCSLEGEAPFGRTLTQSISHTTSMHKQAIL